MKPLLLKMIKVLWPVRVRDQIILGVSFVHFLLMGLFVLDLTSHQKNFLVDQHLHHVKELADALASSSISWVLANDVSGLEELVRNVKRDCSVRYAMVTDESGKVLAHTDAARIGTYLSDRHSVAMLGAVPNEPVVTSGAWGIDVAAPVITDGGRLLGWARVSRDNAYVAEGVNHIFRSGVVFIILAILIGVAFAVFITTRLTSSLNRLLSFSELIKNGFWEVRVPALPGYEAGRLGEGFNQMLDAISARGKENADLRHILDNMAEGCCIIGYDWTCRYVNSAAAMHAGVDVDFMLGKGIMELYPGSEGEAVISAYRKCMSGRKREKFELPLSRSPSGEKWYSFSIEPVDAGIFVLSRDVTERKEAEERIRESEERYRRIVDTSAEGIWALNPDNSTAFVNNRMAEMLGYSKEELIGRSITDFMPKEDVPDHLVRMERRRKGISEIYERRFVGKSGGDVWVIVSATPIFNESHMYTGSFAMLTDITERRKAERELVKSENRYRTLIETISEGVWLIDPDGRTTYVNPRMAGMIGCAQSDIVGKNILDFFPEDDRAVAGQKLFSESGGQYEMALLTTSGKRVCALVETSRLMDSWCNSSGFIVAVTDVTERRRLQDELMEQSRMWDAFFRETITPFAILDRDFNFIRVNKAYADSGQREVSYFPGRNHFELYPSDARQVFEDVVRNKNIFKADSRPFVYPDHPELGVTYWDWVLFPVLDEDGDVEFLVLSLNDVTERKRAETALQELNRELEGRVASRTEELEKNRAELMDLVATLNARTKELGVANVKLQEIDRLKSMFIASMSHELRTPLNSIIGFSSIILKEWCGPINAEQKENMASILAAGKHLHTLINDVIDVSKIEAGKLETLVEDFDLYDVALEALTLIASEAPGKTIRLSADAQHLKMHTDRRRLLQCLVNLLGNAVKFTLEGEVSVKTVVGPGAAGGNVVELVVTDTGIGIRDTDLPLLFSPFVRLPSGLRDKTKGNGLGLYLVKKIVSEILRGEVSVNSEYGKGSVFTIRIPSRIENAC